MIETRKALLAFAVLAGIGGAASGQSVPVPSPGAANTDADRLSDPPKLGFVVKLAR